MTRHYLPIPLSPAEARSLSARARRSRRSVSDEIRVALGIEPTQARNNTRGVRGYPHGSMPRVKLQISDEDRAELVARAEAAEMTTADYVRAALGLPRLRSRRVSGGAPVGNRNWRGTR